VDPFDLEFVNFSSPRDIFSPPRTRSPTLFLRNRKMCVPPTRSLKQRRREASPPSPLFPTFFFLPQERGRVRFFRFSFDQTRRSSPQNEDDGQRRLFPLSPVSTVISLRFFSATSPEDDVSRFWSGDRRPLPGNTDLHRSPF